MRSRALWLSVVIAAGITVTGCSGAQPASKEWGYAGSIGPQNWGKLNPEYATCGKGTEQSPVDIISGAAVPGHTSLGINYGPSESVITNNTHTVEASATGTNFVTADGKKYDLVRMHFHSESEHVLNGASQPVELHFVNKASDGSLLAAAVFVKVGAENGAAQPFVEATTLGKGETSSHAKTINWAGLLPRVLDNFMYQGSLTTPPCTEGVTWVVLRTPVEFSADQIARLEKAYHGNNRPVQPVGSREIIQWP
jgi:carbonic anhydrase